MNDQILHYLQTASLAGFLTLFWFHSPAQGLILRLLFWSKIKKSPRPLENYELLEFLLPRLSHTTSKLLTCPRCLPVHLSFWSSIYVTAHAGGIEWMVTRFAFAVVVCYFLDAIFTLYSDLTTREESPEHPKTQPKRKLDPQQVKKNKDAQAARMEDYKKDLRKRGVVFEAMPNGGLRIVKESPEYAAFTLFLRDRPHCPAAKEIYEQFKKEAKAYKTKPGGCRSCDINTIKNRYAEKVFEAVKNRSMPIPNAQTNNPHEEHQ